MTDQEQPRQSADPADPWQEVGRQFRTLGDSLTAAFRATWENEETQRQIKEVQHTLEDVAAQLSQSVKTTLESEEGQRMQAEVKKAAASAQSAGRQAYQEVQPELQEALHRVRAELDRLIEQVEKRSARPPASGEADDTPAPPDEPPAAGQA